MSDFHSRGDKDVSFIFAWHALSDACPICQSLDGQEFHGQNIFQSVLWSPVWGDIWHLDQGHTLAHPNCRCQLELRVTFHPLDFTRELTRLLTKLRELRRKLEQSYV